MINIKGLPKGVGYWAEKVVAQDRCSGITEFSENAFREGVETAFAEYWESYCDRDDDRAELWEEIEYEVLSDLSDESTARFAAGAYRHNGRQVFRDFEHDNFSGYTYRFKWCCYALPWAIKLYDALVDSQKDIER